MKKRNILCAVRDAQTAKAVRRDWEADGACAVTIAFDGMQALYAARHAAPDVLVVDAVLPGLDGFGVIDRLRQTLGARMPGVIGGSVRGFASGGFLARGADFALELPWNARELRRAIGELLLRARTQVDWPRVQAEYDRACAMLRAMGMREHLRGFGYLAWAAALASDSEERLDALGERIYEPVAARFHTTPQSVERLIRHAVEGSMDAAGAQGVYGFFGNTIDPTRGKPTNAQMIGMLAERLRVS